MQVLSWCQQAGVHTVTVWALSVDNIARRPGLSSMLTVIVELADTLAAQEGWQLNIIGAPERLPDADIVEALRRARHASATGTSLLVNLAVAYDGREEILAAARSLLAEQPTTELDSLSITQRLHQWGQPDCDLIIRTAGEFRLSGFLLWQSSPAELYFSPELWPDFTERSFTEALASYADRERRFGE